MSNAKKAEILSNNFLKTAENIVTHFDDDKLVRDEHLKALNKFVVKVCIHEEKMKNLFATINDLKRNVDDNDDLKTVTKVIEESRKELENYEPDVSEHVVFLDYCRQVKDLTDLMDNTTKRSLGDDDIEMTQEDINIIDPFSKKRMTNPVRNKICGHVYDRETLASVLKMNKNTRCPVVGCSNKEYVIPQNLVTDIKTRKYLHDNPA